MATVNKSCPQWKQLLTNPQAFGDINERREFLRNVVKFARCSPPGFTYCSLCRQLAELSFEAGDKEEGICSLIESHAVLLRHQALLKYYRSLRKCPDDTNVIDKTHLDFFGSGAKEYETFLNRLRQMPEEWTIIQLSCVVDAVWRLGGPKAEKWTPQLHIVRLECGSQSDFEPVHIKLSPPPEASNFVILREMQQMMEKNRTDLLSGNSHEFWKARSHVDLILKSIIDFMNTKWFACVSPFLAGRLNDKNLRKEIKARVNKIIAYFLKEFDCAPLSEENLCLLLKIAENPDSVSEVNLISIFATILNKSRGSVSVKKIWKEFNSLKKEYKDVLNSAKKGPVLLIIDEKLECLPFEQLDVLRNHPVTRVPSFHSLHGLYMVYRNSIKNGLKVVDSNSGFYVINPGGDLKNMEERMSKFLVPRVPKWKGFVGQQISGDSLCEAHTKDMFVYMGHGSGGQYWNIEQVDGGIRSLSLLFGCQSAGYKTKKSGVEVYGTLQAYLASGCPSMLGMLWAVTDKDTDLLAQAILDKCLPKYSEKSEKSNEDGIRRGKKKVVRGESTELELTVEPSTEPDLARAIILGRKAAKMLVTQAAVVVRGLPVYIK